MSILDDFFHSGINSLSTVVVKMRERINASQSKLAALSDINQATISRIESGDSTKLLTIAHLAIVCGYEVAMVFRPTDGSETFVYTLPSTPVKKTPPGQVGNWEI